MPGMITKEKLMLELWSKGYLYLYLCISNGTRHHVWPLGFDVRNFWGDHGDECRVRPGVVCWVRACHESLHHLFWINFIQVHLLSLSGIRIKKEFSIHSFLKCCDSSDSWCTGSHSFPPCASPCFVCCGLSLGKRRWWEWVASRIERIELPKSTWINSFCQIHVCSFSMFFPFLVSAFAHCFSHRLAVSYRASDSVWKHAIVFWPLAWYFKTFDRNHRTVSTTLALQWCFFVQHFSQTK